MLITNNYFNLDVKKIQELTEDIVDDLNINFKLPDLIINT